MTTPDHPPGFHCHTFDTYLLRQIIELSVDTAVRRLCRDRGSAFGPVDQAQWVRTILAHIDAEICRTAGSHVLLPSDIDAEIGKEISMLVGEETNRERQMECASIVLPSHGFLRLPAHAGVFWRKLFKKRPE